jgi:hypothetical protein
VEINIEEEEKYEQMESNLYFAAEKGNLVFCCAYDCWAFTTREFATIWG